MGLGIYIKGLEHEKSYHSGYIRFMQYRMIIAKLYNERIGELYEKNRLYPLLKEEEEEWNKLCNDDLDIFLWHSDCDGKLTVKECRKVYKILKQYKIEEFPFNELHEKFLNNLKFAIDNRRNMYFV